MRGENQQTKKKTGIKTKNKKKYERQKAKGKERMY